MKNYLKSILKKIRDSYNYYKALSHYNLKPQKYKWFNFLCLVKYIIFEELSYLFKLKPRIMDLLEANQLIEEAQKYIGREIDFYPDNKPYTKPEKYRFERTIMAAIGQGKKIIANPFAIFKHITKSKKYLKIPIKHTIETFKKLDEKK